MHKTAYVVLSSYWSSDLCSSDHGKIPRRETQDQSGYSAASGTEYAESDANAEDQPEANADEVESEPERAEADADTSFVVSDDFKAQGATATSSGPTSEIKSAMA